MAKQIKTKSIGAGTGGVIAAMLAIAVPVVAAEEGLSLVPYRDTGGVWTICHGETVGVSVGQKETKESCGIMLKVKLAWFGWRVRALVEPPMSDMRWAGLTSFSYNVGLKAFADSTLLKKLNALDPKACNELPRWKYVGKVDCSIKANDCYGLVGRRNREKLMCESK